MEGRLWLLAAPVVFAGDASIMDNDTRNTELIVWRLSAYSILLGIQWVISWTLA